MGTCCSHATLNVSGTRHPLDVKWGRYKVPAFKVNTEDLEQWEECGGSKLVPLLEHVDLIDLRFIIENTEAGRPVPRWQDVPAGAKINARNLHRIQTCISSLSVLVLSYPWLDAEHPDKGMLTMNRLLPLMKAFLQGLEEMNADARSTVGLLMDYCSLPQKSITGEDDRSIDDKERFKKGLGSINQWYMHKCTTVVVYDVAMPAKESGHTNLRAHAARGWCSFELRASTLVKDYTCLWSLQGFEDGGSRREYRDAWQDAVKKIVRPTPMTPERFSELLRDGVASGDLAFTARADIEVVSQQYTKAFERAFREAEILDFFGLGWGEAEMHALAAALSRAKRCGGLAKLIGVQVGENPCGEAGLLALVEVLRWTVQTGCQLFAADTGCSEAGMEAVKKACKEAGLRGVNFTSD